MKSSYHFTPLDELIDENQPVLDALKLMRDKLLHPRKDIPYQSAVLQYYREVKRRYPLRFLFAEQIQTLIDRYLHSLAEHLLDTLFDRVSRLPDNQFFAYINRGDHHLKRAITQADDVHDKNTIRTLLRHKKDLSRNLKFDFDRRNQPLSKEQKKRIAGLYEVQMMLLRMPPLPTIDNHPATAVQLPMHDFLSSFIPVPSETDTRGFYLGSQLPPPLNRARQEYVTLILRSTLLLSESLHGADSWLQDQFPDKTRSELLSLLDQPSRLRRPTTPEDFVQSAKRTAPGMVALALLADPLMAYMTTASANPRLQIPGTQRIPPPLKTSKSFLPGETPYLHVPDPADPDASYNAHKGQGHRPLWITQAALRSSIQSRPRTFLPSYRSATGCAPHPGGRGARFRRWDARRFSRAPRRTWWRSPGGSCGAPSA